MSPVLCDSVLFIILFLSYLYRVRMLWIQSWLSSAGLAPSARRLRYDLLIILAIVCSLHNLFACRPVAYYNTQCCWCMFSGLEWSLIDMQSEQVIYNDSWPGPNGSWSLDILSDLGSLQCCHQFHHFFVSTHRKWRILSLMWWRGSSCTYMQSDTRLKASITKTALFYS